MNWQESFRTGLPTFIAVIKQSIIDQNGNSKAVSVKDCLRKISRDEKLVKLQTKQYKEKGTFPIIDQGKQFICGYTDDKSIVMFENLPVIIFGDHTRNLKFVDFPFAVGADGTKILKPVSSLLEKYFYYSLFDFTHSERGYSRYFKQLSTHPIVIPFADVKAESVGFQNSVVDFLDALETNALEENKTYFDANVESKILSIQQLIEDRSFLESELNKQIELVSELRQAFLREAMQGKLVPQDVTDEPAEILLKKIKREKAKLIAEKKIKKEKLLPEIKVNENPFEIPESWTFCRLGEAIEFTDNLDIHKKLPSTALVNYVDIDAIDNERFRIRESKVKPVSQLSSRARRVLKKGFIAYSLVRPYLNNIAIIEDEKDNYIGSTGFAVFRPIILDTLFIKYLLLSGYIRTLYLSHMSGFNSPGITNEQFIATVIPLPPLAEQKRIVEKLEKLMAFCDELEANIRQSKHHAETLLQVALKEALEPKP